MKALLLIALFMPLIGALCLACCRSQVEKLLSRIISGTVVLYVCSTLALLGAWIHAGCGSHEFKLASLSIPGRTYFDFIVLFDHVAAVFLVFTAYIASIIIRFSRSYMHREEGYLRFFTTVLGFVFGMNLLILSGTLDTLFAGWEIVGMSSFLLIGFYRSRIGSVQNAFKVFSIYRFCDVGILLASWMSHRIWHESLRFHELKAFIASSHGASPLLLLFVSVMLLWSALGKSAQFPFSFWLPRAMEGPTPSSAIFYGALSVHAGVFLLLRTYDLWHAVAGMNWVVGLEGTLSAIVATLCGRVQPNIKGQIAYASITQVGIMLVELALGFPVLALIHFAGNAGLRCYQLLVSPSVVVHLLRAQAQLVQGKASRFSLTSLLPDSWKTSAYVFGMNEAFLPAAFSRFCVMPLRKLARPIHQLDYAVKRILDLSFIVLIPALWRIRPELKTGLVAALALHMLMLMISALTEKRSAQRAWNSLGLGCFLMLLLVVIVDERLDPDLWAYAVGVIPGWLLGSVLLMFFGRSRGQVLALENFNGEVHHAPLTSRFFLLACLTVGCFPISPAFIGEDILLRHASGPFLWLAVIMAIGISLNGIALARIYTRVCLGQAGYSRQNVPDRVLLLNQPQVSMAQSLEDF